MIASCVFLSFPCLVASVPPNERPDRQVGHDYTAPVKEVYTAPDVEKVTRMVCTVRLEGGPRDLLGFLRENYHSGVQQAPCVCTAQRCHLPVDPANR